MSHEARWGDLIVPGDARRRKVREHHGNGLDGVEVRKEGTRLVVYFLERAPRGLLPGNVRIDGPPGSLAVRALEVRRSSDADRELEDRIVVDLDRAGSPGRYRLRLVEGEPGGRPGQAAYRGIDPRFADAWFVFDVDAPLPPIARTPPWTPGSAYDVSYLGRDYEGLRQLMLDRLGVTIPDWTERHVPDILVTLVELLAYAGDDLSYYADAVATEAYLQTARRRVSIRRHARLVDYRLNEGCTARAWVCVRTKAPLRLPLQAIRFAVAGSARDGRTPLIDARSFDHRRLAALKQYTALPAEHPSIDLYPTHNEIRLWGWGEADSHLARGATHAVLRDGRPANDAHAQPAAAAQPGYAQPEPGYGEEPGKPASGYGEEPATSGYGEEPAKPATSGYGEEPAKPAPGYGEESAHVKPREPASGYDEESPRTKKAEPAAGTEESSYARKPSSARDTMHGQEARYASEPAPAKEPGYGEAPPRAQEPGYGGGGPGAAVPAVTSTDRALHLSPGDVLVFMETADRETRKPALADPLHRQAVRLTAVRRLFDELYDQPLLEVSWAIEDALGFDLTVTSAGRECSRAAGNVVLVAHGVAVEEDITGPSPHLSLPQLSFSTPFPHPEVVARHQARRLRALYRQWRRQLERWYAEALRGTPLPAQRLDALREQLGERELEAAGLIHAGDYDDEAKRAEQDACGLAELLARAERLLAGRRRRAEVLARLAEASGPLDEVLVGELAADWGAALTRPLAPANPGAWGPAARALKQDPDAALAVLQLTDGGSRNGGGPPRTWPSAPDLVGITETARAVVAEIDDEGIANLRISSRPPEERVLSAAYRVGNGSLGNAPAGAINAIVWLDNAAARESAIGELEATITTVGNPLPASGGLDPEESAAAKRAIPGSFLDHQPRALTASDYAVLSRSQTGVRRAAAEMRFSGSLSAVEVALQPALGEDPAPELLARVRQVLESARRIGHVVRVGPPRYRSLVIALDVTLNANAVRAQVADAFAELMSSGWRADGTAAVFNPERLDFGAPVYSSALIAAAHTVDGVESAVLTRFGFVGEPEQASGWIVPDALELGPLELPRLDNDPVTPQHGYALVALEGGR